MSPRSAVRLIDVYTDWACLGNPGPGGWGAILVDGGTRRLAGGDPDTTNNRMELLAAIKGLEAVPAGSRVTVHSDSQYLVNTMTLNWKRRANQDLWKQLDSLSDERYVTWFWVRGHDGDRWNTEADRLVVSAAKSNQKRGRKQ